MPSWLDNAALAAAVGVGESAGALPGFDGAFTLVVTGPGGGAVQVVINDGRLARATVAEVAPDGALILTVPPDDARSILDGSVEPSVAFMRGRLKTAGEPGGVLLLLAATATDGFRAWCQAVLSAFSSDLSSGRPSRSEGKPG